MAQTGYTPILLYSSSTTTNAPAAGNLTNSTFGSELAINIADGKLFYKDPSNNIQVIAWKTTPTTAGGTGLTSYTAGDLIYYASGTAFTKLGIGASGRWLGSSGTAPQWNAPAALTETDDTNVTLTLGGNPSTALLNSVSMTLGWTGQLAVTRGGTGLATVAQGDILYGSASNTLAALAKNTTATRYLSNTGSSNNPAWAQVDLSNGVTGTLPVGNGGTGTATAFTAGSVIFAGASGVYSQKNAAFFWDNTNERLGIGTATPGYVFTVSSNRGGGDLGQIARITDTNTANSIGPLHLTIGATNHFAGNPGMVLCGTNSIALGIGDGSDLAAQRQLTIDSSGNTRIETGNVVIATSGKGIDFSATPGTGTSELLDDYEEGSWTPALVGTGTLTTVATSGAYTKVGRLVTCTAEIDISNWGTFTALSYIQGLPFNFDNTLPITPVLFKEDFNFGYTGTGRVASSDRITNVTYYDNSTIIASGTSRRIFRFFIAYYASSTP